MTQALWTPSRRVILGGGVATLATGPARADSPARVRALSVSGAASSARIVLATDQIVRPATFFLDQPVRFVIDLPQATFAHAGRPSGEGPGAGLVRRYRFASRADGSARLALDLEAPAYIARSERAGGRAAPEISFVLSPSQAGAPVPLVVEPARSSPAPIEERAPRRLAGSRRRTIVVDAGHGGRDPGAVGVTGVREKDVVLDAALQLRAALNQRGAYNVVLTRETDIFIPLPDRVRAARTAGADLFISLHADANQNAEARGASIYTLSQSGASRAQGMIDTQNWHIDTGATPVASGAVTDILVDLTQRETSSRSSAFAETVIDNFEGQVPLLANTHRRASFFVLLAPDVPAVLVEMGFLTNAQDERRLAQSRERERMGEQMARAIDHHFAQPGLYYARA